MPPPRRLARRSFLDTRDVRAFFEGSAFGGSACPDARRSETASRHALTVVAAAVSALDRGEDALDLSEAAVPDLPSHARRGLHDAGFELLTSAVASEATSADGSTTKLVVRLQDGHEIETVLMRHDGGRNTLCVSSQIGCKMACTFCATGTLGELGNLTEGEILEQLAHAKTACRFPATNANANANARDHSPASPSSVTNVVFMGMGEPLNNYASVLAAFRAMTNPRLFALPPRRVTVSTVGVAPKMRALARDAPEARLALSLHAPTQTLRETIVPSSTAYPLDAIMAALDEYLEGPPPRRRANAAEGSRSSKRRAMIEYCVLGGVNDTPACAAALGALLGTPKRRGSVVVNLIPYNPTDVPMGHRPPTDEAVARMANALAAEPFGLRVTIRREMGRDVAGACGQLALKRTGGEGGVEGDALVPGDVSSATRGSIGGDIEDLAGVAAGERRSPPRTVRKPSAPGPGPGRGGGARLRSSSTRGRDPYGRARRSTLDDAPAMDAVGESRTRARTRTLAGEDLRERRGVKAATTALTLLAAASFAALLAALAWRAAL
jgi:adenine C2-methylase RlmN of 23S rRNA A2503 and tRNA A37